MVWLVGALLSLGAYLLGSIPTGYLVAKAAAGIDIREHGSGNTGATNVLRVVGKKAGFTVLVIDLLKGIAAVLLVRLTFTVLYPEFADGTRPDFASWLITVAGLLAIVGHSRSIWLNWTGGKSAATGLGVLLALVWPIGLGTAGVFATALALSRIVSLSSIAAAVSAAIFMGVTGQPVPYNLLAISGSLYVILRHRNNIQRLFAGTEPRLGSKPTH